MISQKSNADGAMSSVRVVLIMIRRYIIGNKTMMYFALLIVLPVIVSICSEVALSLYAGVVEQMNFEMKNDIRRYGPDCIRRSLLLFALFMLLDSLFSEMGNVFLCYPCAVSARMCFRDSLSEYILIDYVRFKKLGVGNILANIIRRYSAVRGIISSVMVNVPTVAIALLLSTFIMLYTFGPGVFLAFLAFMAMYFTLTIMLTNIQYRYRIVANKRANDSTNVLNEVLGNYESVKAYNNESFEVERYNKKLMELVRPVTIVWTTFHIIKLLQRILQCAMDCVIIFILLCKNPGESAVKITQYVFISRFLRDKMSNFRAIYSEFAMSTANALSTYVNVPCRADEPKQAVPRAPLRIRFEDVGLSSDNAGSLNGLTFSINPGDKIAIIGHSGSGKTTLIRIILGFYKDYSGSVKINDVELRDVDEKSLRGVISLVPQDSSLICESITCNILYGSEKKSLVHAMDIAKRYDVHDSIMRLENGYETNVGKMGKKISGGEFQKVSLLRAMNRDGDIFVLDEPTSNIDPASEIKIFDKILSWDDKTVIAVVHSRRVMPKFKRFLFFHDGNATMYETYSDLVNSQLK